MFAADISKVISRKQDKIPETSGMSIRSRIQKKRPTAWLTVHPFFRSGLRDLALQTCSKLSELRKPLYKPASLNPNPGNHFTNLQR